MERVLVTGASGWLGDRLVSRLLDEGRAVRCLTEPGGRPATEGRDAEVVTADLRDRAAIGSAVEGVDAVIHSAAVIHPRRAREFHAVNVMGTRHLVDAAVRAGVCRFVQVSSNAAAGWQRRREALMTEDDVPRPVGGYGRSKLEAERLVMEAHESGRLEAAVIRPCRFYGPGYPPRIARVLEMVASGKVPIFGDGLALRSMSFVDDVVDVLVQCLAEPAATGQVFWIADERPYTTVGAFEAMATAAGVPLRTRTLPEAISRACERLDLAYERLGGYSMALHLAGESRHDVGCSIDKARTLLDFAPTNDLVGGFREAAQHPRTARAVAAL